MASTQCHKPAEKTCHEGHETSFSQKVSEMASSVFKDHGSHHSHGQTTECYSQTEAYYSDHGAAKTQTRSCSSQTQGHNPRHTMSQMSKNQCMTSHQASGNGTACQQGKTKRRGEHKKRGLLQKIKDGISSDSSGSSSSDSESDNEKCGTRKASY